MSEIPMVSVVIPTFNRASSLERLLVALRSQEKCEGGYEVIVVDDGSLDETRDVLGRFPLVRSVAQSNSGPAAARNRGWRLARGSIIAFTDDDTVPSDRWLADISRCFAQHPGAAAIGGRITPLDRGFLAEFAQLEGLVDHGIDDDGTVRYLVTANAAWRRDALEQLGGFDEGFPFASGEDTDLSMRATAAGMCLIATDDAVLAHDHPATLRSVLSTFYRHGRSRDQIVAANPDMGWGERRRSLLVPRHWLARFKHYRRADVGPGRAVAYLALRLLGLGCYATGMLRARRDQR